ncbi:hypothetical protein [Suttonella ornithocola]|uniref:Uncharacterized protein n=1 Tax=Suttonella ornithocola TaxID=279832 RepID=A0A380RB63_9GAMM|nr:hypothetical protein [Suttonella ornithocola]SUO95294.1 Uncharacterised protein [Suttonella ornithocola]SUQ09751.1 Uncharacterised protein [Suttonella ornithocola]
MSYGLSINNPALQYAFDEGYSALNFQGAGITQRYSGNITYLDFNCPSRPVLFYRSAEANNLTAPHYVVDRGNGSYRAYCLGQAEIFVFSTRVVPSNDRYGVKIWGKNGRLVYQSSDQPIKPVARVLTAPIARDQQQNWFGGGGRKIAYMLQGSAFLAHYDIGAKRLLIWRTVVQSLKGGFGVRLMKIIDKHVTGRDKEFGYLNINASATPPWLGDNSPVGLFVIDVHDLDYQGRQNFTFY